ncbi:hypothetical protein SCHPADRAFT_215125 [Schizopora paradoxa]|uniref:Uncharacterized protein n=1 Tax=Schizopora paradoxa TaxID=27342 RepID=A0A0H2RWS4_9AGAM|nr:hypothetical protein SCHPADRAFT_215125 [Schizopora paradoxa]
MRMCRVISVQRPLSAIRSFQGGGVCSYLRELAAHRHRLLPSVQDHDSWREHRSYSSACYLCQRIGALSMAVLHDISAVKGEIRRQQQKRSRASKYARKALGSDSIHVAKSGRTWAMEGDGTVELRAPLKGYGEVVWALRSSEISVGDIESRRFDFMSSLEPMCLL